MCIAYRKTGRQTAQRGEVHWGKLEEEPAVVDAYCFSVRIAMNFLGLTLPLHHKLPSEISQASSSHQGVVLPLSRSCRVPWCCTSTFQRDSENVGRACRLTSVNTHLGMLFRALITGFRQLVVCPAASFRRPSSQLRHTAEPLQYRSKHATTLTLSKAPRKRCNFHRRSVTGS